MKMDLGKINLGAQRAVAWRQRAGDDQRAPPAPLKKAFRAVSPLSGINRGKEYQRYLRSARCSFPGVSSRTPARCGASRHSTDKPRWCPACVGRGAPPGLRAGVRTREGTVRWTSLVHSLASRSLNLTQGLCGWNTNDLVGLRF